MTDAERATLTSVQAQCDHWRLLAESRGQDVVRFRSLWLAAAAQRDTFHRQLATQRQRVRARPFWWRWGGG